jgi:hypothetical protein
MRRSFAKLRSGSAAVIRMPGPAREGRCRQAAALAVMFTVLTWSGAHRPAAAQMTGVTGQVQQPAPTGEPPLFEEPNTPRDRQRLEKMEKARQAERQEQLVKDTDKLFDLAKELKERVDKSNKDMLSIDVVKKAAEIEKLAKSVKDRMRG